MTATEHSLKNKLKNSINNFLYSFYFPVVISAWAVLCYLLVLQDLGLFVLIALAGFIFVTMEDLTPVLALLICFVLVIRDYAPLVTLPYILAYLFLFTCIIVHFIFFPIKHVYLGKLFFPLVLVSMALFLGGVLSQYVVNYAHGLASAFAVGPVVLLIYVLFLNCIKPPENFDIKIYVSVCMVVATVFAGLEVLYVKLAGSLPYPITIFSLGWGNVNTVASMILIALPLCAYLMVKTRKYASLIAVAVYLFAILYMTDSDACMGILITCSPFILLQVFIQSKRKVKQKIVYTFGIAILLVAVIFVAVIHLFSMDRIMNFVSGITYDSGRSVIYKKAIEMFEQNPVLGVGLGFIDESRYSPVNGRYNFHSTVFHVVATMGCAGIIAYTIYYIAQFTLLFNKNSAFNAFGFISVLMLECYGLIDICRFNVIPLVSYITIILLTVELEKHKAEDSRLPLAFLYKRRYKTDF